MFTNKIISSRIWHVSFLNFYWEFIFINICWKRTLNFFCVKLYFCNFIFYLSIIWFDSVSVLEYGLPWVYRLVSFLKLCNIQKMNKPQFINPFKNGRTNEIQKELEDIRINGRVFKNWFHPMWAYENFIDYRKAVLVNTSTNLEMMHPNVTL